MATVRDNEGIPLKAEFSVDIRGSELSIVLESRGGSRGAPNERNTDYVAGMEFILARLCVLNSVIADAIVDSRVTQEQGLSRSEARLRMGTYSYPVVLSHHTDVPRLRKELCAAQRRVGRKTGARGSGNNTKRIRLFLGPLHDLEERTLEEILSLGTLQDGDKVRQSLTGPVLEMRVVALRTNGMERQPEGNKSPQLAWVQRVEYRRNPEVRAWVLERAAGVCELCRSAAPFIGRDGFPYLEVHHVKPLADGGADVVENAVALCPNCHRRCHYAHDDCSMPARPFGRAARLIP